MTAKELPAIGLVVNTALVKKIRIRKLIKA